MNSTFDTEPTARSAIILCTDRNMLIPALFVAHSVRRHMAPRRPVDIVIVTDPGAATDIETRWMADLGIRHHVEDFAALRAVVTLSGRLTAATLVKLTLARIFAGRYDRILYLDTDLTIHGDVARLFDLDLRGHALAAQQRGVVWMTPEEQSRVEAHFAELGMSRPYRYFNAGVLLIDVAAWNRLDLTTRTLDYVRRHPERCLLPDEDSLNAVLDGDFATLSPIWNMPPRRGGYMRYHARVEPVIVHYSGEDKPWRRFGHDKDLFPDGQALRLYRAFIGDSPRPTWLREQWTLHDFRRSLNHGFKRISQRLARREAGPTRRQFDECAELFGAYCAEGRFVDVTRGHRNAAAALCG